MTDSGYMIVAQNSQSTDYLSCARVLAQSIHRVQPTARVALLSDVIDNDPVWQYSLLFPHGDRCADSDWRLANDWQVYDATPFEHTVKLEADMYIARSIEHWWDSLVRRDIHICTTIRNFRGEISGVRDYRGTIDRNRLPDTYNAITYFRRSTLAAEFYYIVRNVFENWSTWQNVIVTARDEPATTDIVYAIAAHMIGAQWCTVPEWTHISMTHMKQAINGNINPDWSREFTLEILPHTLRINTYPQLYPLHYHVKHLASMLGAQHE